MVRERRLAVKADLETRSGDMPNALRLAVGERHLKRILQHHVGLSAKAYGRIRRLQSCIGAIRRGDAVSLADSAYHAGYTDQAHFSHDLKQKCGVSPRALLNEQRLLVEPNG